MNKLFGIFNESFPLEDDRQIQLVHSLLISFGVVLIFFLFKPLGLANVTLPLIKLIPVYIGYGVVTMISCLIADKMVRPAFPYFFDDQLWTVGKHIVWTVFTIMLIAVNNLFYSRLLGFIGISGTSLLTFQFYTFAAAIVPVTLITILRRVGLLSKTLKEVKKINERLLNPLEGVVQDALLVFNSDNGTEFIKLYVDQFMYAESSNNYTDIVYIENGIVRRALIHSSLKRIEEMNTADFVIRVHKAFLVNMRKVKKVTGNAQGLRLGFENLEESIPVSRRVATTVKDLLNHLHGG